MRTPVFRYLLKQGDNYVRLVEQNLITVEQLLARHERRCPECRFQVCLIESRRHSARIDGWASESRHSSGRVG